MQRSSFLRYAAGAMTVAALPMRSARALASDIVDVTLTAAPSLFAPAPGVSFAGLAYNGSIPGPLLRVTKGQRFRARFVNQTGQPATIHWHGMVIPNAMDGVPGVTQAAVPDRESFVYEFTPNPSGTRWYHDHAGDGVVRGLFGLFVVDDPSDEPVDAEFALVFHDVPKMASLMAAMNGTSAAPMVDPMGSPEMRDMRADGKMGDEVLYSAHCINGASYPNTKPLAVKVGQRVRLRILNANPTQTRYVRLAGHRLTVTHGDGNKLAQPLEVDALRIGVGERYDATFTVTKPGAWLLQGLSSAPTAYEQAALVYTEGMQNASPLGVAQTLDGVDYFTYEKAGGVSASTFMTPTGAVKRHYDLGGGEFGSSRWTMNGLTYPHTQRIAVRRGDTVVVTFANKSDMDHPMHLHGHVFDLVEMNGVTFARPLQKDTALIRAYDGTMTWRFAADSPLGRWVLHCHNEVHMMDGMMTEVDYRA